MQSTLFFYKKIYKQRKKFRNKVGPIVVMISEVSLFSFHLYYERCWDFFPISHLIHIDSGNPLRFQQKTTHICLNKSEIIAVEVVNLSGSEQANSTHIAQEPLYINYSALYDFTVTNSYMAAWVRNLNEINPFWMWIYQQWISAA